MCHDMHDCSIRTGDRWMKKHFGRYARWAPRHNSLLVVTFDENAGGTVKSIPTIIVGANVRPGCLFRAAQPLQDAPHHRGHLWTARARPRQSRFPTVDHLEELADSAKPSPRPVRQVIEKAWSIPLELCQRLSICWLFSTRANTSGRSVMMPSTPKLSSRRIVGSSSMVQTSTLKIAVVRLANESSRDDRNDAFELVRRLQQPETLGRKGGRDAASEGSNRPASSKLEDAVATLALADCAEAPKSCPGSLRTNQRALQCPSGFDLAEHGLFDAGTIDP